VDLPYPKSKKPDPAAAVMAQSRAGPVREDMTASLDVKSFERRDAEMNVCYVLSEYWGLNRS
jgi:hypothetical protein